MNVTPYPARTALHHRLLEAELDPHVEVPELRPDSAKLVLDHLPNAGALLHDDQPLAADLVEGDGLAREPVTGRAGEDHLVVEERLEDDAAVASRRTDDAELELALGHAFDDGLGVEDRERDVERPVPPLELAEQLSEHDSSRPRRCTDLERPGKVAFALAAHLRHELFLEGEHSLRTAVEPQAGLGRLDAAAGAVEELRPEPLLERAHLKAHGGLRHAESLGGLRKAAPLDDRAKRCELSCVHNNPLYLTQLRAAAETSVARYPPPRMLEGLAHWIIRHRRAVIAVWVVTTIFGVYSAQAVSKRWLTQFSIPGYSAYEANQTHAPHLRERRAGADDRRLPQRRRRHEGAGNREGDRRGPGGQQGLAGQLVLLDRQPSLRLEGRPHDVRDDLPRRDSRLHDGQLHQADARRAQGGGAARASRST